MGDEFINTKWPLQMRYCVNVKFYLTLGCEQAGSGGEWLGRWAGRGGRVGGALPQVLVAGCRSAQLAQLAQPWALDALLGPCMAPILLGCMWASWRGKPACSSVIGDVRGHPMSKGTLV